MPYVEGGDYHELKVNLSSVSIERGCGTYNDPYIISTGKQLDTIANIINGQFSNSEVYINYPNTSSSTSTYENDRWCNNKTAHKPYHLASATTTSEFTNDNGGTVTRTNMRIYLSTAYYKIDDNITLPRSFKGLGAPVDTNENEAKKYTFRGYLIGETDSNGKAKYTITNKSEAPLIKMSDGCVVKDVTVIADSAVSISQKASTTKLKYISSTCMSYGAVIGQIMGGDTIIDNVGVRFTDNVKLSYDGKEASKIVPIGGYVGIIELGGLYFRNMDNVSAADRKGLTNAQFNGAEPVGDDKTMYLYVNPIVGRVVNAFVFTESNAYRPFEDGSRKNNDGTTDYWHEPESGGKVTSSVSSEPQGAVGVTMRNGLKNYSIGDVDINGQHYVMEYVSKRNSYIEFNLTVHNAQELYIMSMISQAGISCGGYEGKSNVLYGAWVRAWGYGAYTDNRVPHNAQYDQVGFGLSGFSSYRDRFDINSYQFDEYYGMIDEGRLPITRAYKHTEDDHIRQKIVLPLKNTEIIKTRFTKNTGGYHIEDLCKKKMETLKKYGLIEENEKDIHLTHDIGRFVADEVCECFNSDQFKPFPKERYAEGPLNPYNDNSIYD